MYAALGLIIFEMFASSPGGPSEFQDIVRALMAVWLNEEGGKSEPDMRRFLQAALDLYDETNKPPSEDGDLYEENIPPPAPDTQEEGEQKP